MKRIAMIQNGVVQNIAAWDGISKWDPGPEWTLIDVTAQPSVDMGWILYDGVLSPPQD